MPIKRLERTRAAYDPTQSIHVCGAEEGLTFKGYEEIDGQRWGLWYYSVPRVLRRALNDQSELTPR